MPTKNQKRAKRVNDALKFYKANGLEEDGPICKDTLTDFLTDLRHWADAHGFDLHDRLNMSYQHYVAEKRGED